MVLPNAMEANLKTNISKIDFKRAGIYRNNLKSDAILGVLNSFRALRVEMSKLLE